MTREQIFEELWKCRNPLTGFVYWLINYVYIEDKEAGGQIRFKLWESQKRILPTFLKATYLFILKARQLGLTWLCAALCLWVAIFRKNQNVIIISQKEGLAVKFLDRVKFIFDRLPEWMRPMVLRRNDQILYFGEMVKDKRGNERIEGLNSIIYSSTTTPSGAQSETINLLILDEAALIEHLKKIWRSSKPGVDSAKGRIIVISNAIKDGPGWIWFREWYLKAWRKSAGRVEHVFMPWWDRPGRSQKLIEHPLEPGKQIAEFLATEMLEGMDQDDISMHYPSSIEEAVEAMSGSYFGRHLAKHNQFNRGTRGYLEEIDGVMEFTESRGGTLTVWEKPDGDKWRDRYVIGSDISEGLGQTDSAAYVFDREKRKFIAKLKSSNIDADQWGDELIKLANWCKNFPMIVPELSGAGQSTVKRLRELKYPRIFRDKKPNKIGAKPSPVYGLAETRENKKMISGLLKTYFRDVLESVPDGELIDQCTTYIRHSDGHYGKEDDIKKDDLVVAAACTLLGDERLPKPEETKEAPKKIIFPNITRVSWEGYGQEQRDPWVE